MQGGGTYARVLLGEDIDFIAFNMVHLTTCCCDEFSLINDSINVRESHHGISDGEVLEGMTSVNLM